MTSPLHLITMSPTETEEILVLYGSQTGNSEHAAIEISDQIEGKLSTETKKYSSRHMQLDDFLEIEDAKWTRNVIIVTSSYGVGQAPLGCYRFRAFCDAILEEKEKNSKLLDGIHFAMLGLGDSRYTTFFQNPTAINEAMLSAGAIRIGELGKADAKGKDENKQDKVILRWTENIWDPLKEFLSTQPQLTDSMEEKLKDIQSNTLSISRKVLPSDNEDEPASKNMNLPTVLFGISILIVLVAFFLKLMSSN